MHERIMRECKITRESRGIENRQSRPPSFRIASFFQTVNNYTYRLFCLRFEKNINRGISRRRESPIFHLDVERPSGGCAARIDALQSGILDSMDSMQRALRDVVLSRGAILSAVCYHQIGEHKPVFARDDAHQVTLDFFGVVLFR